MKRLGILQFDAVFVTFLGWSSGTPLDVLIGQRIDATVGFQSPNKFQVPFDHRVHDFTGGIACIHTEVDILCDLFGFGNNAIHKRHRTRSGMDFAVTQQGIEKTIAESLAVPRVVVDAGDR